MTKRFSLGIVVLMILATCFLASCSSEVSNSADDGKLVYATFDDSSKSVTRPESSSITVSYNVDEIDDLYWVYSATKDDAGGTTGQTEGKRVPGDPDILWKGLSGTIGPFSKGYWNFTVKGYKYTGTDAITESPSYTDVTTGDNFSLVYEGYVNHHLMNVGTEETPEPIDVTVYLQTEGGAGMIIAKAGNYFFWASDEGEGTKDDELKLKIFIDGSLIRTVDLAGAQDTDTEVVYYMLESDIVFNNVPAATYEMYLQVVRAIDESTDLIFFTSEDNPVNVKVYSGQETDVTAELLEGSFAFGHFNGTINLDSVVVTTTSTIVAPQSGSVSFETSYTPASNGAAVTDNKTAVTISNGTDGDVIDDDCSYRLRVAVSNVEASQAKTFVVENDIAPVAAIDLTLLKIQNEQETPVDFEGNGSATIVTYVATGLENVKVFYDGEELVGAEVTYDPSTGRLSFITTHFSEFYVTSSNEAYNAEKGKAYASLGKAFAEVGEGETIYLLRDVNSQHCYLYKHDFEATFDLNGHTLRTYGMSDSSDNVALGFAAGGRSIRIYDGSLTVQNGTIDGRNGTLNSDGSFTPEAKTSTSWGINNVGGCIRIESTTKVVNLKNLTMYNNDGWGSAVSVREGTNGYTSPSKVYVNKCSINSILGACIDVYGYCEVRDCELHQDVVGSGSSDWLATCVGMGHGGHCDIYNSIIDAEVENGATVAGIDALSVYTSGGTITVYGGSFGAQRYLARIWNDSEKNIYDSIIEIKDGIFTANGDNPVKYEGSSTAQVTVKLSVEGGTYNFDPTDYVAYGYKAVEDTSEEGWWIIEPDTPVITVQKTLTNNTIENMAFFGDGDEAFAAAIEYAFDNIGGSSVISIKKNLTLQSDYFYAVGDETEYDEDLVALADEDLPNVIFDFEEHSVEMIGEYECNFYFGNANVFFRNGTLTGNGDFGVLNHLGGGDLTVSDMTIIGTGWLGFALTCGGDTTRQHDNPEKYDVASLIVIPTAYLTCYDDWGGDEAAAIAGIIGHNYYEVENDCNVSIVSRDENDIILFKFVAVESN